VGKNVTELEDPDPKSEPRRPGRGGKLDGPTRMLNAAIEMLGRQPPSSITGRRLAKNARVHHTLIGQTYGTVASLLAAAYKRERDAFIEAELSDPLQPLRPFALADYPRFWRAHVHFLLDPFAPEIAVEMARSNPLKWAAASMEKQYPHRSKDVAHSLAAIWWSMQIGALVFEKPLAQGIRISVRQRDLVRSLTEERMEDLLANCPDELEPGPVDENLKTTPLVNPDGVLDAKEWALIEAAADLLTSRADAGISGRELAGRAKVNYGLIHYYFGSKESVFDKAFIHLHKSYVEDVVGVGDVHRVIPFKMIGHAPFLRAWAGRELAEVAMPPINLVGMGLLLEYLLDGEGVDRRSSADLANAQANTYCAIALQLGWVLSGHSVAEGCDTPELVLRSYLFVFYKWFLSGKWLKS
jgi:AcrR family transcriptional regulator